MKKNLCCLLLMLVCTQIHAQENREYVAGFPGYEKIFQWVEANKNRKEVFNVMTGNMAMKNEALWTKNGTIYASTSQKDLARFHAATGEEEDYTEPFQGMISRPECVYTFSVSPTSIVVVTTDKIQVACNFDSRTGNEKAPKDGAAEAFHCKSGTRSYTAEVQTVGGPVKLRYTATCTHQNIRKSRKTIEGARDVPEGVMITTGRGPGYRTRTSSSDYYPPYHQVHKQTTTFNLDESARLSGISKKELATRLLMTADLQLPLVDPQYLNSGGGDMTFYFGSKSSVQSFGTVDANLFVYFMSKTFGFTEEYLSDMAAKITRQGMLDQIEKAKSIIFRKNELTDEAVQNYIEGMKILNHIYVRVHNNPKLKDLQTVIESALQEREHIILVLFCGAKSGDSPLGDMERYLDLCEQELKSAGLDPLPFMINNQNHAYLAGDYHQNLYYFVRLEDMIPDSDYPEQQKYDLLVTSRNAFLFGAAMKGKYDYALGIVNRYIEGDPNQVKYYAAKCWIYVCEGDYSAAMKVYNEDVLRLAPDYSTKNTRLVRKLRELRWIR